MSAQFLTYHCTNPDCSFRFPVNSQTEHGEACPRCGAPARIAAEPHIGLQVPALGALPNGPSVEALLDNIRSTFNVGAMFRTADGAGLRRLHLCGITPCPDQPKVGDRIRKTALGAETVVPYSLHTNALETARALRTSGMHLWALEGGPRAQSIFEAKPPPDGAPILLIVGNEVSGVDPGLLELSEQVIAIPMLGYKESLNVAIAFGIAAYLLRFGLKHEG